jgi:hypothetical protein
MSPAKVSSGLNRASLRPEASSGDSLPPLRAPRLLDQLRERARLLHYSLRTEQAYVHWCRAFIRYYGLRHPAQMGGPEVEAFLTWLVSDRQLSASTHRQALSALLFLYGKVLGVQLPWMRDVGRPRIKQRLPVVLSQEEVSAILRGLEGEERLFAQVLYGTGMRLTEGLRLRVKDLDFAHQAIVVRHGKGGKDRILMLPQSLIPALRGQLSRSRALCVKDVQDWSGRCGDAGRTGAQVPSRRFFMALVLGVSPGRSLGRPTDRRGAQAPHVRPDLPASIQAGGEGFRCDQAGDAAHPSPCVRHPPAAIGLRHPNCPGSAGSCRRGHHDDLHPRASAGRCGRS